MPIYEYRCSGCEDTFEQLQQMSDPDPEECPGCGSSEVERLVSRSSFHLKGGGWFEDGYASSGGEQTASAGDDSGSTDTGSAGTGSDDSGEQPAAE